MISTANLYQQKEFHSFIEQAFPNLIQLKKEDKKEAFNKLILEILPSIKKHINGRLDAAIRKGLFSKNKYNPNKFIDQIIIEVYDHIDEVKMAKHFYLWLFKKTEDLLEDRILEEELYNLFFKNIGYYSKSEWSVIDEKFNVDGDMNLLMIEGLDNNSYSQNNYTLNHVFIEDDEQNHIDILTKELNEEDVNKHIQMVLNTLSLQAQSVFQLYGNHEFDIEEIAIIKRMRTTEVKQLLQEIRNDLRTRFLNRYLIEN